jgi:hypothetical protein
VVPGTSILVGAPSSVGLHLLPDAPAALLGARYIALRWALLLVTLLNLGPAVHDLVGARKLGVDIARGESL